MSGGSNFSDVGDFHEKFGLHRSDKDPGLQECEPELLEFRARFMQEELDEFYEGMHEGNDAKMFDALLDIVYVALGTAHLKGYPWQRGWELVQQANMAKVRAAKDGSDSKRGSAWDVVKPEGWTPPDIESVINDLISGGLGECPVCHKPYTEYHGPYECRPGYCAGVE